MAKLKNGILGPISGSIGPITGATWKEIAYIKERPKKTNKKRKSSPAQLAVQHKFRFIQHFMVPFYPYINVGFSRLAKDKTEINAAFSANYKTAFSGVWPDIKVDYASFKISSGRLMGLHHLQIARTTPLRLELSWERATLRNVAHDDQLMLVVYSPELKMTDGFIGGVKRNALSCSFDLNARFENQDVEVYVSMTSASRKSISDSIYLGRMEI
jgi:hypothetical protein